jgi:phage terminase large subunit-like protein
LAILRASGLTPDPWQGALLEAQAARILMLCARQTGKSTLAAALALGEALQHSSLVLLLSPSLRQSQELFRKVLELYRRLDATIPTD